MEDAMPETTPELVTILDSSEALDVTLAEAAALVASGDIFYCDEATDRLACACYHIDRRHLANVHGVDFEDDEAGWRWVEQRLDAVRRGVNLPKR
jgi:hypothetical protein